MSQQIPSRALFTADELYLRFDPDRPGSYLDTFDFETYLLTKLPTTAEQRNDWAEQDQAITDARDVLIDGNRCVAIMGTHRLGRSDASYRTVAEFARRLARSGDLVLSGGGPGAMEAVHLGAAIANRSDDALNDALQILRRCPDFPHHVGGIVRRDGSVDPDLAAQLHLWQVPAFEVLRTLRSEGEPLHPSLSIPTWFYGHEPPTPFATHIAKYISNALREDGLLAIARYGVVFAPGRAGTVQEVFQDAAQNAYRTYDWVSPMCFLDLPYDGVDRWWTEQYPVRTILEPLLGPDVFNRYVRITPDVDEAFAFMKAFVPDPR